MRALLRVLVPVLIVITGCVEPVFSSDNSGAPDAMTPFDAGSIDSGGPDAGVAPDSGQPDSGPVIDAGFPPDSGAMVDSGPIDSGSTDADSGPDASTPADAGMPDGGNESDSGVADAGESIDSGPPASDDAGAHDAGGSSDAGETDSGSIDSGPVDSGTVDAGPADAGSVDGGLMAIPLMGCPGIGYSAALTLGGTQTFQMLLDTGSTTTAIASTSCTDCAGVTPEYSPGSGAIDQGQMDQATYGDGSGWSGEIYQDAAALVGVSQSVPLDFVAIDAEAMGFFPTLSCDLQSTVTSPYQGILGLGPTDLALPGTSSFISQLAATGALPNVFAVQLCPSGGRMWVGGYDPAFVTEAPQYTPIEAMNMNNTVYYTVQLTGAAVGGTSLNFTTADFGPALVDTGTSAFLVPDNIFQAMATAVGGSTGFGQAFPGQDATFFSNGSCLNSAMTRAQIDAALPALSMTFPSASGPLTVTYPPTQSYLYEATTSQGIFYCSGLASSGPGGLTILGDSVLGAEVTIFDLANNQVGFAPQTGCP